MYKYPMQGVYRVYLQRLWRDRAGNVLVLAAACMPLLIGAAGLAVDTTNWTYWKRQLQREADSAALAGAYARAQGKDAIAAATSDLARTNVITLSTPADIKNGPTTGAFAGNPLAVRVALSTQTRLPFSGTFMSSVPVISAHATAAILVTGQYCALALGTGDITGISMTGNSKLNFGCGLATNSSAKQAVDASGSTGVVATPIAAVGGLSAAKGYVGSTQLLPYSLPQKDPYASVPNENPPTKCTNLNVKPKDVVNLSAVDYGSIKGTNCFSGATIKGTVTFRPGIYYIDGGTLDIQSGAVVSIDTSGVASGGETGVTFVLTSSSSDPSKIAQLSITGNPTINLAATTLETSPYEGILFYQDRRALLSKTSNFITGDATSSYHGAFYFPSQVLNFSGSSGMSTNCLQLVAWQLIFSGNTSVNNKCDKTGGESFAATVVKLVE